VLEHLIACDLGSIAHSAKLAACDRRILQDCYGSIAAIASKSAEQILEQTPCSKQTALAVEQFFTRDIEATQ
jgi:hypothetical protein